MNLEFIVKEWKLGNHSKAITHCKKYADMGDPTLQRLLGWMYYSKEGEQQNLDQALCWFKKAADNGDCEALFGMASVFYTLERYARALELYEESYRNGHKRALFWIGAMYELGIGTERDVKKAEKYYKKGMDEGYFYPARAYVQLLFREKNGLWEKIKLIPLFLRIIAGAAIEAWKNPHSELLADCRRPPIW